MKTVCGGFWIIDKIHKKNFILPVTLLYCKLKHKITCWDKLCTIYIVLPNRLELETKIQESERRKIDEDAHRQAEREKLDERVAAAMEAKDSAEKELLVIQ